MIRFCVERVVHQGNERIVTHTTIDAVVPKLEEALHEIRVSDDGGEVVEWATVKWAELWSKNGEPMMWRVVKTPSRRKRAAGERT